MVTRVIDDTKLQNIAVAIQSKDSGGQMTVDEMPGRIEAIPSGGGSEIASAAVNQNGTISFYDADGNPLFTTSGEKMVTSGAQQISMGYDNGGFYFLFDDGQEA